MFHITARAIVTLMTHHQAIGDRPAKESPRKAMGKHGSIPVRSLSIPGLVAVVAPFEASVICGKQLFVEVLRRGLFHSRAGYQIEIGVGK